MSAEPKDDVAIININPEESLNDSNAPHKRKVKAESENSSENGDPPTKSDTEDDSKGRKRRKRRSGWDVGDGPTAVKPEPNQAALQQQQQMMMMQKLAALQSQMAVSNASNQQRLARRIYVGSLPYELTEEHVMIPFSAFGHIVKVDMPREQPGRSKGFCFLEYASEESATNAIASMNGAHFMGRSIKVGRPSGGPAGSGGVSFPLLGSGGAAPGVHMSMGMPPAVGMPLNPMALIAMQQAQLLRGTPAAPLLGSPSVAAPQRNSRIYIGSIPYELQAAQVKEIFAAFGQILSCDLIPNPETGTHKGYGFIEFADEKSAQCAMQQMDGFELLGRQLRVGPSNKAAGGAAVATSSSAAAILAQAQAKLIIQEQKGLAPIAHLRQAAPKESRCIRLDNMVDASEVDADLEREVKEECSLHGAVDEVTIHQNKEGKVRVFILYQSKDSAAKACDALDRRYFGGKVVSAAFYDIVKYVSKQYDE